MARFVSYEQYAQMSRIASEFATTFELIVGASLGQRKVDDCIREMSPETQEWWRLQKPLLEAYEHAQVEATQVISHAQTRAAATSACVIVNTDTGGAPHLPQTPNGGIRLSDALISILRKEGTSDQVLEALRRACAESTPQRAQSYVYARAMHRAYAREGMAGIFSQIDYLLLHLAKWTGEQAREDKKLLRQFSKHGMREQRARNQR